MYCCPIMIRIKISILIEEYINCTHIYRTVCNLCHTYKEGEKELVKCKPIR